MINNKNFYSSATSSRECIGPHREDILSTLVGGLLGDCSAEKRSNATRFFFHASSKNVRYIRSLHKLFADNGYCNPKIPDIRKEIGQNNKICYVVRFKTYSFTSLNYLYDAFYDEHKLKFVPVKIEQLLTNRALAIWIMVDGGRFGEGLKLSTDGFTVEDVHLLQEAVYNRFKIRPTVQRHKGSRVLSFVKADREGVLNLVKGIIDDSMLYKFRFKYKKR
jgi:hypothetical protein